MKRAAVPAACALITCPVIDAASTPASSRTKRPIVSGDEIRLTFAVSAFPAVQDGWTRDFLLMVDGWAKDADANTAFSQSVEPLPFHTMSAYPYPAAEHYPDDVLHRNYRDYYNTRPALRLLRPLTSTQSLK